MFARNFIRFTCLANRNRIKLVIVYFFSPSKKIFEEMNDALYCAVKKVCNQAIFAFITHEFILSIIIFHILCV